MPADTADAAAEIDWCRWARCDNPAARFGNPLQCVEHCPSAHCAFEDFAGISGDHFSFGDAA